MTERQSSLRCASRMRGSCARTAGGSRKEGWVGGVRGIADELPECLTVDITPLKIGDNARVRDLDVEGLDILLSESALLVACKRTRAAMSAESELEGEEGAAEGAEGEGGGEAEGGEG